MEIVGALATHYHPDHIGGELFGFMGLMLVFVVLQGLMLGKYMEDKNT